MIIEKKHRLPKELYRGKIRAAFTICVDSSKNVFIEDTIVEEMLNILKKELEKGGCINWVYTFMPDHLHLVIEGVEKDSDLREVIIKFKQKSGYYFSKMDYDIKWQKDFYDHIFRKEEDLIKHIKYILNNPVRKGLVSDWREYRYSGSLHFKLCELF